MRKGIVIPLILLLVVAAGLLFLKARQPKKFTEKYAPQEQPSPQPEHEISKTALYEFKDGKLMPFFSNDDIDFGIETQVIFNEEMSEAFMLTGDEWNSSVIKLVSTSNEPQTIYSVKRTETEYPKSQFPAIWKISNLGNRIYFDVATDFAEKREGYKHSLLQYNDISLKTEEVAKGNSYNGLSVLDKISDKFVIKDYSCEGGGCAGEIYKYGTKEEHIVDIVSNVEPKYGDHLLDYNTSTHEAYLLSFKDTSAKPELENHYRLTSLYKINLTTGTKSQIMTFDYDHDVYVVRESDINKTNRFGVVHLVLRSSDNSKFEEAMLILDLANQNVLKEVALPSNSSQEYGFIENTLYWVDQMNTAKMYEMDLKTLQTKELEEVNRKDPFRLFPAGDRIFVIANK